MPRGRVIINIQQAHAAGVQPDTRENRLANGTVKKLVSDRGFGFIQQADGTDLFFHRSAVTGVSFDELREGQAVTYDKTMDSRRNKENAENVRPA